MSRVDSYIVLEHENEQIFRLVYCKTKFVKSSAAILTATFSFLLQLCLTCYVVLNNKALKCEFVNESQILWEPKGAHPAWYYGRRLNAEGDVTSNILDAARNGEDESVRALLDSGVDPETRNPHGWTALHKGR